MTTLEKNILNVPNEVIKTVRLSPDNYKMQVLIEINKNLQEIRFNFVFRVVNNNVFGRISCKKDNTVTVLFEGPEEKAKKSWNKLVSSFKDIIQSNIDKENYLAQAKNEVKEDQENVENYSDFQEKPFEDENNEKVYDVFDDLPNDSVLLTNISLDENSSTEPLEHSYEKIIIVDNKKQSKWLLPLSFSFLFIIIVGSSYLLIHKNTGFKMQYTKNMLSNTNLNTPTPGLISQIENYNKSTKIDPGYMDVIKSPVSLADKAGDSYQKNNTLSSPEIKTYLSSLPPDKLNTIKAQILILESLLKEGHTITPDMLSTLPDPIKNAILVSLNSKESEISDTQDQYTILGPDEMAHATTDKYGIPNITTDNFWVKTNNVVDLLFPGGGNLTNFDEYKILGLGK
jgi:acylphosphatase